MLLYIYGCVYRHINSSYGVDTFQSIQVHLTTLEICRTQKSIWSERIQKGLIWRQKPRNPIFDLFCLIVVLISSCPDHLNKKSKGEAITKFDLSIPRTIEKGELTIYFKMISGFIIYNLFLSIMWDDISSILQLETDGSDRKVVI